MGELTNSTEDSNKLKEEYSQVTKLKEKKLQLNEKWYSYVVLYRNGVTTSTVESCYIFQCFF